MRTATTFIQKLSANLIEIMVNVKKENAALKVMQVGRKKEAMQVGKKSLEYRIAPSTSEAIACSKRKVVDSITIAVSMASTKDQEMIEGEQ